MIRAAAGRLSAIASELASEDGGGHAREAIPVSRSAEFPLPRRHLELLHEFASGNPIYYESRRRAVAGTECVVYEGDTNRYWLSSIRHGPSRAPFSPTWMMSAYVLAAEAARMGYPEAVDVGSGDGRIAFCSRMLNCESYSIEIDGMLADLQRPLATILDFGPRCADAAEFDYAGLGLSRPAFFIGGLAQMGGVALASAIMDRAAALGLSRSCWVLAGTSAAKYAPDPEGAFGWGGLIARRGLREAGTLRLPTAWSMREPEDTPYVFAESG